MVIMLSVAFWSTMYKNDKNKFNYYFGYFGNILGCPTHHMTPSSVC